MARWIALICDGPLFLLRAGLTLFRVYLLIAVSLVSLAMLVWFIALLLQAVGIRWAW